ncbi:hypothetical protein M6B38_222510 [Iris pallida]|uniref:Uncharacterized protein n=1 Tax=Iris pallida TaxID=29817 RepID=A0AAX6DWS4_IRIPA|nr:hypothetical protein M6B38_222510 [Iris pallida]
MMRHVDGEIRSILLGKRRLESFRHGEQLVFSDLYFSYSTRSSSPVDRSEFPRSLSLDRSKSLVPIWTMTKLI